MAEYSLNTFYTSASDRRGHNHELRVVLPPDVDGELSALVASQRVPEFKTKADILRDALHHRLHFLAHELNDPDLERRVSLARQLAQLRLEEDRRATESELVKRWQEVIREGGVTPGTGELMLTTYANLSTPSLITEFARDLRAHGILE